MVFFLLILFCRNRMVFYCSSKMSRSHVYMFFLKNRTLFPDELSHSYRQGPGAVSPRAATRKGAGVRLPVKASEESASHRGFSSQPGLGEPRHSPMQPGAQFSWGRKGCCWFPGGLGPHRVQDHQGLRDLVTPASSSRHFPPNQACLREGKAQHFIDHPHLPLRA